jgi:hemerythrin superfamily protein
MADGLEFLASQHRDVEQRFAAYRESPSEPAVREICQMLTLHAEIEEKVLYPEVRRIVDDGDDLADEAEAEHALAKTIIARIYDSPPPDLQPVVSELEHVVSAHVGSEESTLFPALREAGTDLEALGDRLATAASEAAARLS